MSSSFTLNILGRDLISFGGELNGVDVDDLVVSTTSTVEEAQIEQTVVGFTNVDPLIQAFTSENHNNLIVPSGYQIGYVLPLGNFFEIKSKVLADLAKLSGEI